MKILILLALTSLLFIERPSYACTQPQVLPGGDASPDTDTLCRTSWSWDGIAQATTNQWPPGTYIWQPLSCYDTGGSAVCELGWSDGSEWGNFLTRCVVLYSDPEFTVNCTTDRMR